MRLGLRSGPRRGWAKRFPRKPLVRGLGFREGRPDGRREVVDGVLATARTVDVSHDRNSQWERSSVRAGDGTDLAVWSCGSRDGVPVLLVHGFSLDHTTWHPVGDRLANAGFRVIAVDLRGYGESDLGPVPPTLDGLVAHLAEVLATFDLPEAHLVGHSLGAVVVLRARVSDRLSGSIKSVTSIAGTERSVQNPVMRAGARLFSSSFGIRLLHNRIAGRVMISAWFGKRPSSADLDWIREMSAACALTTRSAVASATSNVDLRSTFGAAGAPTLVICGRRDKATPVKFSERIAGAISGAEFHVVEDAGHMVIIEEPDIIAGLLVDWFARLR